MPRALTTREKRLLRGGAAAIVLYLAAFYGLKGYRWLEDRRIEYEHLAVMGQKVSYEIVAERNKGRRLEALKRSFNLDPAKLREEEMVGEARSAIQKAAESCGVAIATSREVPGGGGAGREAASIQLEGQGPAPSFLGFIFSLRTIGFPILIDRVNLQTAGMKPGQVRFSLVAVVLSYRAWHKEASGA